MSGLREAAQEAQDGIGWAKYTDPAEMVSAVLDLARVVVQLAAALDRLEARLPVPLAQAFEGGPT